LMFNGVWRVQATKVEPLMDGAQQVGWQVTETWRNGTSQEIAPGDSFSLPQVLQLSDGSKWSTADTTTAGLSQQQIDYHDFPASGQFTYVQIFRPKQGVPDPTNKPKVLLISFDNSKLSQARFKPHFTTAQFDYAIKLDCTASTTAAAAQGGSSQIPGKEGCMNEWMSNGVWRMRTTAIAPDNNNDNSSPQIGWMITEDWVSLVNRPISPSDTNTTDQQLVLGSGNTIASSNTAGTSINFGQLGYHTFAPGGSFTYQQRFRLAPFDPTDKPVRLIVTFDATKEKMSTHAPQFTSNPPNFRISFQCSK